MEVEDAPLTPLRDMSIPKYNASPANHNSTTPMSLSDAFASMGETANAPLSALGGGGGGDSSVSPIAPIATATINSTTSSSIGTTMPPIATSASYRTPTATRPPMLAQTTTTPGGSISGGGFGFWSLGGSSTTARDHASRIASTPNSNHANDEEDDFGDFGSATPTQAAPLPSIPICYSDPTQSSNSSSIIGAVSVSDAFGDMVAVADAPLPSLDAFGSAGTTEEITSNNPMDNEDDDEDDGNDTESDDGFGNFEEAAATGATTPTERKAPDDADGEDDDDDDDGFGNFKGVAATNISVAIEIPSNADDSLAPIPPPSVTESGRSLSITDAFGSMPIQQDTPLPSLGDFASTTASTTSIVAPGPTNAVTDEEDDGSDDGFGDFEDAAAAAPPPPSATTILSERVLENSKNDAVETNSDSDDNFGDFGGATGEQEQRPPLVMENGRSLSITDAFGDMPVQADATLPSLGDLIGVPAGESKSSETILDEDYNDDDDDDFGDFEDAEPSTTEPEAKASPQDPQEDDGFGNFADATSAFIAPESPPSLKGPQSTNEMPPAAEHARSVSIDDAFDAFSTPADAPLPPLELLGATSSTGNPTSQHDNSDDDFGDFSGTAPQDKTLPSLDKANEDEDEFGDFGTAENKDSSEFEQGGFDSSAPVTEPSLVLDDPFADMPSSDAPLPSLSLGMMTAIPTNQTTETNPLGAANDEIDDEFGGFESPTAVQIEPTSNSLDMVGTEPRVTTTSDSEEDDFGGFGSAEPLPEQEKNVIGVKEEVGDDFGDFGSAQQIVQENSQPADEDGFGDFGSAEYIAPIEAVTRSSDDDDFGNFGSAPAQQNGQEDNFGDFGSTECTTPVETSVQHADDDDNFGDFGSAPAQESNQADDFGIFANVEHEAPDELPAQPGAVTDTAVVDDDDFGDFGSANLTSPFDETAKTSQLNEEDDFGILGAAKNEAATSQSIDDDDLGNFGNPNIASPAEDPAEPTENDDFGDFEQANLTLPVEAARTSELAEEDDFGDFGRSNLMTPAEATLTSQPEKEDDFGDFGSANLSSPAEVANPSQPTEDEGFGHFGSVEGAAQTAQPEKEDDFGDFGSSIEQNVNDFGAFGNETNQTTTNAQSGDEDFFGAFGSAEAATPIGIPKTEQNIDAFPPKEEDDFGGFGSADFSPSIERNVGTVPSEGANEFGNFTVVDAPQVTEPENDDNFGNFSNFQDSSPPESSTNHKNDDSDEWGDFENISKPPSTENKDEFTEEVSLQDRILSLALQLPDCVLRKAGVSGDHVDLGESFEVNVGTKSFMTETTRKRTYRCIQVLESLTSTNNSKLASTLWVQIFDVVNEELEQAKSLLIEATASFPSGSRSSKWGKIQAPLSIMVRGLAEYMRVTRSIVASIGDVLLLDESAMLTVDTWASTWCSLSVLEKALDCEKNWKAIEHQLSKTPLGAVRTASVEEIRSDANRLHTTGTKTNNATLCHLTLQPLQQKNKNTTKAEVSFQGKCFMACSANFLANRCSFFVVGEEM